MRNLTDMLLTRRELLHAGSAAGAGYWFLPLLQPANVSAAGTAKPRGTARFCIFVMLDGGQSHVDAWDLKEHSWTPSDFNVQEVKPGLKWPMALYPRLALLMDKFSLIRSFEAWDSVHGRAQYYVQAAHPFNPALQKEVPPMGAVVAMERQSKRKPSDSLPPYVALNVTQSQAGLLKSGFLPAAYSPFHVDTAASLSAYSLMEDDRKDFVRRWNLLRSFDARLRNDPSLASKAFRDFNDHYEGAVKLMLDPRTAPLFRFDPADRERYGSSAT
ncbi:MAG: DUF1501 domain-containing protein, partial [Bryobacterales bacterium]|nr:DUF1501 domain-containing protein [Bryobacterales bacterium]